MHPQGHHWLTVSWVMGPSAMGGQDLVWDGIRLSLQPQEASWARNCGGKQGKAHCPPVCDIRKSLTGRISGNKVTVGPPGDPEGETVCEGDTGRGGGEGLHKAWVGWP